MSQQQLNLFEPIEVQTRDDNGNKRLVNYGIQTDESDYRVHVGYISQHIFVFPTPDGVKAIEENFNTLRRVQGSQPGTNIITFDGFVTPISLIDNLQSILIPSDIYNKFIIHNKLSTTTKGLLATSIVAEMLKRGLVMLPVNVSIENDIDMQIKGTDIIIRSNLHIQVKCDMKAGEKRHGGSGNLFLQVAECNPRHMT